MTQIIFTIFVLQFIAFCNAFSYWNMRCPSQSEWGVISSWVCNGIETKKYTCLYNAIRREYEESCKFQPVISGNGKLYDIVYCVSFVKKKHIVGVSIVKEMRSVLKSHSLHNDESCPLIFDDF